MTGQEMNKYIDSKIEADKNKNMSDTVERLGKVLREMLQHKLITSFAVILNNGENFAEMHGGNAQEMVYALEFTKDTIFRKVKKFITEFETHEKPKI